MLFKSRRMAQVLYEEYRTAGRKAGGDIMFPPLSFEQLPPKHKEQWRLLAEELLSLINNPTNTLEFLLEQHGFDVIKKTIISMKGKDHGQGNKRISRKEKSAATKPG